MAKQAQPTVEVEFPRQATAGFTVGETLGSIGEGAVIFGEAVAISYQATRRDQAAQRQQLIAAMRAKYRM